MSKKDIKTPVKKEEEDDSTARLSFGYRKRCDSYGFVANLGIKVKLDESVDTNRFQMLHSTEEIGAMQVRAFMEVAAELKYEHLRRIRIWKGGIGDEGVRFICKFMTASNSLEMLDLMDNGITALGCEFIGKTIGPNSALSQLKLDNNPILSQGLKNLAVGLRLSPALDKLSLKYGGINSDGAKHIQAILANIHSRLRSLKLQGNPLGVEGGYQVLRAVEISQSLQKINIADTKMELLDFQPGRGSFVEMVGEALERLMSKNLLIIKYDIRFNPMDNSLAVLLLKAIGGNTRIKKMEFANNVSYQLRDELDTVLRKRNKEKKGSKAKKGKK